MYKSQSKALPKPLRTIAPVRIYGMTTNDQFKGATSYECGGSLPAKDALAATTGHNGFQQKIEALVGKKYL